MKKFILSIFIVLIFADISIAEQLQAKKQDINIDNCNQYGISLAEEREIGITAAKYLIKRYGYLDNDKINSYVKQVGQNLVNKVAKRNIDYTFYVLNTDEINSFALPGGFIFVTKGTLAYINNEAELAGILSHEIAHIEKCHCLKTIKNKS